MSIPRARRSALPFIILISLLILGSCAPMEGRFALLNAQFAINRGDERQGISSLLKATTFSDSAPFANYGLGTVYLSLGEIKSALDRFALVDEAEAPRELRYRTWYNAGLACYRSSDFEAAVKLFRKALEADGSRIEAKRNLELSLRQLRRQRSMASSAAPIRLGGEKAEHSVLFEYLREKEGERWKSREWQSDPAATLDY